MKHLIALSALLIAGPAFADSVKCEGTLNSGTYAEFEMLAAGTATLAFDYREFVIDMNCQGYAADIPVYECVEIIPGGNKFVVQFALGAGQAYVSQESNTPGFNTEKGTLTCK
ncbi:hypothetical protein [Bdellovibrio bacteriovorus]|uniref:hypothetical protein n=1 Tax=Bdellovibrio bacteriovorus TaxID=959 RepID=UPI003AA7EED4